ncbi:MAG: D-amino-acid dehydrogenase [Flavobacteriales bacterium]|jgi:D-amino-acid dehydrogenase
MKSFWIPKIPSFLDLPFGDMEKKDVVIVGAGVIGLCSAYYLQEAGRNVTIVDRLPESDQGGCSFINCGYIAPSHFVPLANPGVLTQGLKWMFDSKSPLYIKPRLNMELMNWLWLFARSSRQYQDQKNRLILDLNLESKALFSELEKIEGIDTGKQDRGLLMYCQTEKALHHEMEVAEMSKRYGVDAVQKSRVEIHQMEPDFLPNVVGGVFFPEDAHLNPVKFVNSLRSYLKDQGVEFLWGSSVSALRANDQQCSIDIGSKEITASQVVIAGGSWSSPLAKSIGLKLPMQAGKGYSLTVKNPEKELRHPAILVEAKIAMTPLEGAMRFGGTMELNGLNPEINATRVNTIKSKSMSYLNGIDNSWFDKVDPQFGFRPVSPDGLPYIGPHPHHKNIVLACGHAMLGLSMGPVTGKLVAGILEDGYSGHDLKLLRPERFA